MEFHCEDLPQHGVLLIPPASPEYDVLLADIQRRMEHPVEGSPPVVEMPRPRIRPEDRDVSAILVNRSPHGIAAIQQVWTLRGPDGRAATSSIGDGGNPSVLLPFGLPAQMLKLYGYWHVILPGSKRYLSINGDQAGDNSDVRPPDAEERWKGGIGGGGGGRRLHRPMQSVTLTLDGVFFTDGGFAGPNRRGLWEQVVYSAEAHMQVAALARRGREAGMAAGQLLAEVERLTGPAAEEFPRPPGSAAEVTRESVLRKLAWDIGMARKHGGDERTVGMLMSWVDARPPEFHKL
jgi:hypothetical protein